MRFIFLLKSNYKSNWGYYGASFKVPQRGSCVKIWRVKCNGKCLKHMADASDCALALYHLKDLPISIEKTALGDCRIAAPVHSTEVSG